MDEASRWVDERVELLLLYQIEDPAAEAERRSALQQYAQRLKAEYARKDEYGQNGSN